MRDCNRVKDVSPITRLCPGCQKNIIGAQKEKRQDNQVRQNSARASAQDQHRDMNVSLSPTPSTSNTPQASAAPPRDNLINFPNIGSNSSNTTNSESTLPTMDMPSLQNTYNQMAAGNSQQSQGQIFTDMYGMLLNVLSKQTENDGIKQEVKSNSERIRELEAKVGNADEIS